MTPAAREAGLALRERDVERLRAALQRARVLHQQDGGPWSEAALGKAADDLRLAARELERYRRVCSVWARLDAAAVPDLPGRLSDWGPA